MQLQLHAWQALHLELLLLSIKSHNDGDGARLSCAAVSHSLCAHRQCRSIPVCLYVPISAGIAVKWVRHLGSWRCSMCKQVLDHQVFKSSPLCTRLTRHRANRQIDLITCHDSVLLSKRFVVRRLLKTCRVATAEDTQLQTSFSLQDFRPANCRQACQASSRLPWAPQTAM